MALAVGIHLDSHSISAVRLDGSAKNPVITAFAAERMPQPSADSDTEPAVWQARVLDEFIKRHKFPRENVFFSVAGRDTVIRQFTVPFLSEDQIRKTIIFQAEAHIHSVPIDDLELTWRKIGEGRSASEVLINAIHSRALRETLRTLKHHASVEPVGVDTPIGAAANTIINTASDAPDEHVLWIDIGVATTTMMLTHGRELKAVRVPKIGVNLPHEAEIEDSMRKAVSRRTDTLPGPGARHVTHRAGNDGPFELPEILDDTGNAVPETELGLPGQAAATVDFGLSRSGGATLVLQHQTVIDKPEMLVRRMVTEVTRTIVSLGADAELSAIRLSGGGEAAPVLGDALRAGFPNVEVEVVPGNFGLKTRGTVDEVLESRSQALAVPLGMALKGIGLDHLGFEFRRGEFALEDSFDVLKGPVMVCVLLLTLLFGALCKFVLDNQARIDRLSIVIEDKTREAWDQAYVQYLEGTEGYTPPEWPGSVYTAYEMMHRDFNDALGTVSAGGDGAQARSCIEIWQAVQQALVAVGREPQTEEIRSGQVNGTPVSRYMHQNFPRRRGDPERYRPEDIRKLELEWSITRFEVSDRGVEIRGRAVKPEGIEAFRAALASRTDLFDDVNFRSLRAPRPEEGEDDRDNRSVFTIECDLVERRLPPPPTTPSDPYQ